MGGYVFTTYCETTYWRGECFDYFWLRVLVLILLILFSTLFFLGLDWVDFLVSSLPFLSVREFFLRRILGEMLLGVLFVS